MAFSLNEDRFLSAFRELLETDSVTGQIHPLQEILRDKLEGLGLEVETLRKGGLLTCLGGSGRPLVVCAHADTIGLMVRHIHPDGTLKVVKVGGLYAYHAEHENIRVHTRSGKVITGALQRARSSVHVTPDALWEEAPDFEKNCVAVLDADVHSAEDVRALGIQVGDYVALDPKFAYENGYLKSRFIDDKALVALLLEAARTIREEGLALKRKVYLYLTFYEEIGHGGSFLPADTEDFLALDIACTGPEQTTDERKVTVFCMDSRFPYHQDLVRELEELAEKAGVDYVPDIFTPHYGTDGDPAMVAGYDIRHGAIGPGVSASHGYERSHMDGMKNTYKLLMEVMTN